MNRTILNSSSILTENKPFDCYYVLAVPTSLKKIFSRYSFTYNIVQVFRSMHSSMQLLYLLLFFVIFVSDLVAISPYYGPYAVKTGTRTTAEKNHISGFLFTSSYGPLEFYFLRLKLCEQRTMNVSS